jgi:sporulation protein YlmC with PRC-barrel domain
MRTVKLAKACSLATALASATVFGALAQSQPSLPAQSPSMPSAVTKPDAGLPHATSQSSQQPIAQPKTPNGVKVNPLLGLAVFSADGNRLGLVHSVNAEPDGNVKAIHIRTGGFLGFGGKLVAIPEGKFRRVGENIMLQMRSDEVDKLPELKEPR